MCDKTNKNNYQNNANNHSYWDKREDQQKSDKTSAEIAAELWDSWLGNPDDHEPVNGPINDDLNKLK